MLVVVVVAGDVRCCCREASVCNADIPRCPAALCANDCNEDDFCVVLLLILARCARFPSDDPNGVVDDDCC